MADASTYVTISLGYQAYGDYTAPSPKTFYYVASDGRFHTTQNVDSPVVSSVTMPTLPGIKYNGWKIHTTGETAITASGEFTEALIDYCEGRIAAGYNTSSIDLMYDLIARTIIFNKNNGSGGLDYLYWKVDGGGFYWDGDCLLPFDDDGIEMPIRSKYKCAGYYQSTSGGTCYFMAAGYLESSASGEGDEDDFYLAARMRSATTNYVT